MGSAGDSAEVCVSAEPFQPCGERQQWGKWGWMRRKWGWMGVGGSQSSEWNHIETHCSLEL